jgi:hypothetical protein
MITMWCVVIVDQSCPLLLASKTLHSGRTSLNIARVPVPSRSMRSAGSLMHWGRQALWFAWPAEAMIHEIAQVPVRMVARHEAEYACISSSRREPLVADQRELALSP